MIETDEEELIRRAQHDVQAFIAPYERYVNRIYGFAYSQVGNERLANDVTSATFEKALSHIRTYEWLFRIAANQLAQQDRNARFTVPLPDSQNSNNNMEKTSKIKSSIAPCIRPSPPLTH